MSEHTDVAPQHAELRAACRDGLKRGISDGTPEKVHLDGHGAAEIARGHARINEWTVIEVQKLVYRGICACVSKLLADKAQGVVLSEGQVLEHNAENFVGKI